MAVQIYLRSRHIRRFEEELGLPEINRSFFEAWGEPRVLSGPFEGMLYLREANSLVPKLIGSYESELHRILSLVFSNRYTTVINIGCAEGYYAVGLALQMPHCRVLAFDLVRRCRRQCRALARKNGVEGRVSICERCDCGRLNAILDSEENGKSLIVADCEGFEYELLVPAAIPRLATADLLIELHEWTNPGLADGFLGCFAATHSVTLIGTEPRDPFRYAAIAYLSEQSRHLAVNEFRHTGQRWAFLEAKASV